MESRIVDSPADDAARRAQCRYTLGELAQLANTSPRRVSSWLRAGLLQPAETNGAGDTFSFQHVRTAGLLAKLTRNGFGTTRLKRILDQLQRRFPNAQEALSQLDLFAGLLVIRDDERRLTAPNGQLLLDLLSGGDQTSTVSLKLQAAGTAGGADELFNQSVSLEESGDLEGAERGYREFLMQNGPDVAACFNLANVLAELGHSEAAAERYRQVVELDPQYAAAWNNLGLALAQLGCQADAVDAWRRAVAIHPDSAAAVFNLADALQEAGHHTEARPFWDAYLRLDAENEWSSYARFCLDASLARKQ